MRYELPGLIGNISIESYLWLVYLKNQLQRAPLKGWPNLGGFYFMFSCDTAGRQSVTQQNKKRENSQPEALYTIIVDFQAENTGFYDN